MSGFDEVDLKDVKLAELYMLSEDEMRIFLGQPYSKLYCRETKMEYKKKELTVIPVSAVFTSIPNLKDARVGKLKTLNNQ